MRGIFQSDRTRLPSLVFIFLSALAACRATRYSPPSGRQNPPLNPDIVVITRHQHGSSITVPVGKKIPIPRPLNIQEWQTDYDGTLLAPLTPPEKMRAPGPGGWLFQAIAPGQTDLMLTSSPPLSSGSPPPTVARFVFTINVQK